VRCAHAKAHDISQFVLAVTFLEYRPAPLPRCPSIKQPSIATGCRRFCGADIVQNRRTGPSPPEGHGVMVHPAVTAPSAGLYSPDLKSCPQGRSSRFPSFCKIPLFRVTV
jgi:hypothetical protein